MAPETPAAAPAILEMTGISKSFPGVRALDGANLRILPGEVHGLVGENGAGKSTIIKVLAGIYPHDQGAVRVDGEELPTVSPAAIHHRGVRFVHQELQLVPTFSVTESVFMGEEMTGPLGLRSRRMRARAEQVLNEVLGVEIDGRRLIRDLGPAERKLVQIARALVREGARLVVFDEPTAPLAAAEAEHVLAAIQRLRDQGISSLYVSHYLAEITRVCDRVTVFRNGTDVGVVDDVGESTGGDLIRMMVGRDIAQLFPERDRTPGGVALSVVGAGDGTRFGDVSLDVAHGEILGVTGLLGSGTAELVDGLMGLRRRRTGTTSIAGRDVRIASPADALRHGMVLIPRDRRHDGLVLDMTVADNINLSTLQKASRFGLLRRTRLAARAGDVARQLDIRPDDPSVRARLLSGGNQQKVVIGRSLAADAGIFVLDEPTVGVDIGAKEEVYRLVGELAGRGAAVIVVSNDSTEILGLCDRVVVMLRGRIVFEAATAELTTEELIGHMTGSSTDTGHAEQDLRP